jgi:PAS domain S-box-containing protein
MAGNLKRLNSPQLLLIAVLLLFCLTLEYYFHSALPTKHYYTHVFYIPIALAAIWWGLKGGLSVSLVLALLYVSPQLPNCELSELSRTLAFILTGSVLGIISDARRHAELALSESRQWLATTLRSIGDGVIATNARGLVTFLNPVAKDLTGWDEAETVGKPIEDIFAIINEQSGEKAENPVAKVLREGVVVGLGNDTVLIAKDGTKRAIADSGAPMKNEKGNIIGTVMVFRDVTERKRTEEQLAEYRDHLEDLVEKRTTELANANEVLHQEITQRKQAQEKTEHLGRVLRAIRDVDQLIVRVKDRDNLLKSACDDLVETGRYITAWIALVDESGELHACAESGLGESFLPLAGRLSGGDLPYCARKALAQSGAVVIKDTIGTCGDCPLAGTYGHRAAMVARLENAGTVYGILKVSAPAVLATDPEEQSLLEEVAGDIAFALRSMQIEQERKQAELELQKHRDHLAEMVEIRTHALTEANKELESFNYSVSHDLRAPLRAISGFSAILTEDYSGKLDHEGERILNVIQENTQTMGELIDGLLALSRLGRREIRSSHIDMEKLAQDVFDELEPDTLGPKPRLTIRSLPPAYGDPVMIRQVFTNLLSNAIKFTQRRTDPEVEISATEEEHAIVYSVKDNGVGFDMEYVEKLFGVFQRLHSNSDFAGSGIGLANVKRIVTRHGGRVWAEGKGGEGATFYFTLPKSAPNQLVDKFDEFVPLTIR